MSSNQRKREVKLVTLQMLSVKHVAGALNIFTEVQKETFVKLILQMVRGNTIEFENDITKKHNAKNPSFSPKKEVEIKVSLEEILYKQIIRGTTHESAEFASPIFIVKKPGGGTRLILNLKKFNAIAKYVQFEMDGIKIIINIITRNCFMVTKDLKDACYSVAISRRFQKFLKFKWKDKLYCFKCFPNSLGSCPRKSTKLNKVPNITLHFENTPFSGYIDDFLLKGTLAQYVKKTDTKQCACTTSWVLS